ncbi:MAG: TadE/TadG family type IV pilus assembly protein [Hyphomicrobiaceae bacterium]
MAAIEFAMVLPILFVMFVGTIELSQAITADRRVTQIASSTADLVARTKTIKRCEIDGIMQIVNHIIKPYSPADLQATIASVVADPNNAAQTTVAWSYHHNGGYGSNLSPGNTYTLPEGVVAAGDSVIVASVRYTYNPTSTPVMFSHFITAAIPLTETFFLKPRLSSTVEISNDAC